MAEILEFPGPKARTVIRTGLTDADIVGKVTPPTLPAHAQCPVCTPQGLGPVCADCLRNAPMRVMVSRRCLHCAHAWIQPARTGGCPKCHACGDYIVNDSEITNGLKRV